MNAERGTAAKPVPTLVAVVDNDRMALLGITAFSVSDYASRVAAAGAQGIASKADMPQLAQALRAVAAGGVYAPPALRSMVTFRTHAHRAVDKLGANSLAHAIAIWLSQ